jgi:hypothetical protein
MDKPRLSHNEVWERVRSFAEEAARKRWPIYTLQRKVKNVITEVKPASIGRQSDEGRTHTSRVTKSKVLAVWDALLKDGGVATPPGVLFFTPALMLRALPDVIEYVGDGKIALRDDPKIEERDRETIMKARRGEGRGEGGGGEGEIHRALKRFIYEQADSALLSLGPGPYTKVRMEHVFPTGDRVDVVLLDGDGNVVLVEVKPELLHDDLSPWAQASKYRALWSVLEERPVREIRCVVAAPRLPASLAERMLEKYHIESVAVELP